MQWRSRNSDPDSLDALHPGIPAWMVRPVATWIRERMTLAGIANWDPTLTEPNLALLQEYETSIRATQSRIPAFRRRGVTGLLEGMDHDEILDLLDFLVFKVAQAGPESRVFLAQLDKILEEAGSEWKIGQRDGFASLERRVPEGVAVAATEIIHSSGSAGGLLAEAWHSAFGRNPDYEEAYEKAIKAVEEAGAAIVLPNDRKATLGTMIRTMADQAAWTLPLGSQSADAPVAMARALWQGQESRHGGHGYRRPTQQEAEAAVLLAVPLVQWFASGVLSRP